MTVMDQPQAGLVSDQRGAIRAGGVVLALGAAGVVATSVLYGVSPPAAAMPLVPADLAAALAGAIRGATTMHLAGLIGVFGDVLVAAAALLFGQHEVARGRGIAAMGWFLIAISTVLFAVVDSIVGYALSQSARQAPAAFPATKNLFDALFLLGTATFGLGAVLALATSRTHGLGRLLALLAVAAGAVALLDGALGLCGVGIPPHLLGAGIAGGSLVFTLIGIRLAAVGRL
ncbi:MAG: hypothetical protein WDN01_12340 [Rhizomicrobium sp.]